MKAAWLAVCLVACSSATQSPRWAETPLEAEPTVERSRVLERAAPDAVVPAEPFSAAWVADGEQEGTLDAGEPRDAWVTTDACAEPTGTGPGDPNDTYGALMNAVLDRGKGARPLVSLQVFPTFQAPRALDLLRGRDGGYRLRLTSLPAGVWSELTAELTAEVLAGVQQLSGTARRNLVRHVTAARVFREQRLDAATAQLLIALWREVIARAQFVEEVNPVLVLGHSTGYLMLHGGKAAIARSPQEGSVLGDVALAAEHLERVLNGQSTDEAAQLGRVRHLLRDSFDRTRRKEPCLRHYDPPRR